jgi:hypothetical protein
MGGGTFAARVAIAAVLLAVAGCGSGAATTPTPTPIFATSISNSANAANPTGQHWTGTITSTSERHYFDGGANYACIDAYTGTLSLSVNGPNAVTGSGALNLQGAASCAPLGAAGGTHGLPPETQTYEFSVSGVKTTARFTLQFTITKVSPPGSIDVAGIKSLLHVGVCPPTSGPKLSIALDRPNHATGVAMPSATIVQDCPHAAQGAQNDIFSSTSTIVLSRS